MSKKVTDIVSYLTPVGLILAFLLGDRENSRFHLNQALVLCLAEILLGIVERILDGIPVIGTIISVLAAICGIGLFVLWIMGLVSAIQGTERKVPVLGDIVLYR